MFYITYFPKIFQKLWPTRIWWNKNNGAEKTIYLTFDDGPHPTITPIILDKLKQYNFKASFFCVGKNVEQYNNVYQLIVQNGHSVGNHTYSHINAKNVTDKNYLDDFKLCDNLISSNLFRPPYGRLSKAKERLLKNYKPNLKIIMWSHLSGDFDYSISSRKCYENSIRNLKNGSIIVFHDSEKAWPQLGPIIDDIFNFLYTNNFKCDAL